MRPTYIVIHHSFTKDSKIVDWNAIRKYHMSYAYNGEIITREEAHKLLGNGERIKRPWKDIGYHFGIEKIDNVYEILVGRMMDEKGAHCIQQGMNNKSIGICCIGNFDDELPPQKQMELCIKLVRSLMNIFNISRENVVGHREYASYKSCPGSKWSMDEFRKII
jgi:N-acetylmuramoyl-L-alanine amidase